MLEANIVDVKTVFTRKEQPALSGPHSVFYPHLAVMFKLEKKKKKVPRQYKNCQIAEGAII